MTLAKYVVQIIRSSENILQQIISRGAFPPEFNVNVAANTLANKRYVISPSFMDVLRDGFVWNTPKCRKSIEKRHLERFGGARWGTQKILKPNRRIRIDYKTGEHFELGKLAPKTYEKILQETSEIKAKISDTFGRFSARDKEANVLYEGESVPEGEDNKLTVSMEKQRPTFFSRNLTEKTQIPAGSTTNTTVRPSGLG